MFKKFIVSFLLFVNCISFSQELVGNLNLELKRDKNIFQIINDSTKSLTLFFSSKSNIKAIRLNDKFEIKDSLVSNRPNEKYEEIIGYTSDKECHNVFWSNYNNQEIYIQIFNYTDKTVTNNIFLLEFDKETIVQKFSYNNKFYIISTIKNTNDLRFHVFDSQNNLTKKTITIKGDFFKLNHTPTDLYGILKQNLMPFEAPFSLIKISVESPVSLSQSSKKRKCYLKNNNFAITLDNNTMYTQVIDINLTDFKSDTKIFKNQELDFSSSPNSNSFLFEEKIYQIKNNADKIIFTIKNLNDELLKEHIITKEEPINFKNSEIIQLGGFGIEKKILTKTSQFIRKNHYLSPGIACYNLNGNNMITIGCVSEDRKVNVAAGAVIFGLSGVFITLAVNAIYDNFNQYSDRKVVYFNSLFDKNSNHIESEINDLAFDKIKDFKEKNKSENEINVFRINNNYYLTSQNMKEKKYSIRKFED
jgi:hypothetical protein